VNVETVFYMEQSPGSPSRDFLTRAGGVVGNINIINPFRTHGLPMVQECVYGLNGHRLYYIISLFKVTYKSTIQVSRNFHALFFTKTL
jgi:hypothetical protein